MKKYIIEFWSASEIPYGAKVLTTATSVLWFGWGFAETLIPVLLYSFAGTYAEAGLLHSSFDIALILALPIIGLMADKMRATTLVLIGLFLYLFVGASYFLIGITGLVIFIVIARLLNGISYAFVSLGRETYFFRNIPTAKIATVFGYFDTMANFWWIAAALVGIFLIKYFSITNLLFLIIPAALISFFIVLKFRKKEDIEPIILKNVTEKYSILLREFRGWSFVLKSILLFNFFISFAGAVVAFFLPIEAYTEGANLSMVVIIGVISATPMIFGWGLGKWFDIKGSKVFTYGLFIFGFLILSLSFLNGYFWKIIITLLVSMVLELLSVGSNELLTVHSIPEHFGRVNGVMQSLTNIGGMLGPLTIGILIDVIGIKNSYAILAIIIFVLACLFHILQKRGFIKKANMQTPQL